MVPVLIALVGSAAVVTSQLYQMLLNRRQSQAAAAGVKVQQQTVIQQEETDFRRDLAAELNELRRSVAKLGEEDLSNKREILAQQGKIQALEYDKVQLAVAAQQLEAAVQQHETNEKRMGQQIAELQGQVRELLTVQGADKRTIADLTARLATAEADRARIREELAAAEAARLRIREESEQLKRQIEHLASDSPAEIQLIGASEG